MVFSDKYTTSEKIAAEQADPEIKDKIEKDKTVLSNDAYAIGDIIQNLINKIEHTRSTLL